MVLSNSKAPTSSSSEVQAGSGTEGEAQAEVSVVGGESAPAATLPTLSAPELLQQLQLMEEEIRRAKLIVDPSLAQATITSSEVSHFDTRKSAQDDPHAHHTTSDSSHKHHHESQHNTQHSHPHSHKADSATTATSTTEGQKVLSLSTPSSKKTHENRQFSLSASSVGSPSIDGRNSTSRKGHSGTASQRIYASSPHSPRSVLSSSKASQNSHHQHQHSKLQDVSFASGGLMNLSLSRSKLDSSGRINRSSPLVRHVDLSIFKSPKSHCRNVSRNVYDDAKLTWVSTQKTAAAKKERFQSTNDLMLAKEVNPVFFSNDV